MGQHATAATIREAGYGLTIPEGDATDAALERLIRKAELRVLDAVPTYPARVASGRLDPGIVEGVVEDMVLRVVRNPRAVRSTSIDDYSETLDTEGSVGLYLTDQERESLIGLSAARRGRVGQVRVGAVGWWCRG